MTVRHQKYIIIIYSMLLIYIAGWFFLAASPIKMEMPLHIILGGLLIFFLPGLLWCEIFGFRADHILEVMAFSFALTLSIEVILLPIPFLFGTSIRLWLLLLFFVSLTSVPVIYIKFFKKRHTSQFLKPLFNLFRRPDSFTLSNILLLSIIVVLSYGTYRWGEDLYNIDGEKLLHMSYIRYYFSMPLVLSDVSIYRGTPPPNLVYLWEFLIAGWAALIKIDPLFLFFRARFIIPVISFAGLYLLVRSIFIDIRKSEAVIWVVLLMSIGGFILLSPSNFDWVKKILFDV